MAAERPKCWGRDFNSEDRECKGCPWQVTCREQVIRDAVNRQPAAPAPVQGPPMNYYQQPMPMYQPPAPVQPVHPYYQSALARPVPVAAPAPAPAPVPVQVQPAPAPFQVVQYQRPAAPAPAPMQAPVPVQQPQPIQVLDWYGRFQDPVFYQVATAPPPYRPQHPGETFFERVAKNVGLSMLEAVFMQCFLAVRQMVLPPVPPRPPDVVEGTVQK
jgi:hypothetical protein